MNTTSRSPAAGRTAGTSMLELMFAMAVVGVATMIQVQQMSVTLREYHVDQDAQFASRKAADMLAELQASVDQGQIDSVGALVACADAEPSPFLTTRGVPAPDHVMSGNSQNESAVWTWWRCIEVEEVPGAYRSRYVRIRVLHEDKNGHRTEAAVVSGLLNVPVRAEPAVQTYDVYALAIDAAPSLWQPLPSLRAELQSVVGEIAGANPNLRFRIHWITKFGYGRDPFYTPYVNATTTADAAAPYVYWYPGRLAAGASSSTLFAAELFGGRVRTEAGVLHDFDAVDNPYPHAVADRMNHCVRTPEARELFARRVAAGIDRVDEPPLQVLLADMVEQPERFRNAIVVNLHGSGLPFPPIRNYSDAAKDPVGHPEVRVVTHPAQLHTTVSSGTPLEFRVYAYKTTPTSGPALLDEPITLQIFGGDFRATMEVGRQEGGVNLLTGLSSAGILLGHYGFSDHAPTSPGLLEPFEMWYESGYSTDPAPHTWLRFHNTPLACPVEMGAGIDPQAWLYGTDYIPSPVTNIGGFYAMSNTTTADTPKNTVRWRVQIPTAALTAAFGNRATVTVTTRIGTDLTTGRMWPTAHEPQNLSTTYAWWSNDPDDVPITERYQFQGDPRHNPYVDLCVAGTVFQHGYNWWFDNFVAGAVDWRPKWNVLDTARLMDGFGLGVVEDVPRMWQVWREALQTTHSVLVNPAGRLAGHVLLGGEIALPGVTADKTPVAVALHRALYGQAGNGTVAIDDLDVASTASTLGGRPIVRSTGAFWAKPWLGELAPDAATSWTTTGNLTTAAGYLRAPRSTAAPAGLPRGTDWSYASGSGLMDFGGACLLQTGSTMSTFVQSVGSLLAMSTLTDDAYAFSQSIGLSTPRTTAAKLPFSLTGALSVQVPLGVYASSFPLQSSAVLETLASAGSGTMGAAAIRIADPGMSTRAAYFVPMAVTPRLAAEHHATAYRALVFGLRTLFVAGEPARGAEVLPLPLVRFESPEPQSEVAVGSLPLRWSTRFLGFDEQPYTAAYLAGFSGSESDLVYVVTWRRAAEQVWHYAANDAVAVPGELPASPSLWLPDTVEGEESWTMPLSSAYWTPGDYVIRIDCYRQAAQLHAAYHELQVKVR